MKTGRNLSGCTWGDQFVSSCASGPVKYEITKECIWKISTLLREQYSILSTTVTKERMSRLFAYSVMGKHMLTREVDCCVSV